MKPKRLRVLDDHVMSEGRPLDGVLEQRAVILDNLLLNSPPVVAQRIRVELVKECMKFPEIFLPSTVIL